MPKSTMISQEVIIETAFEMVRQEASRCYLPETLPNR